MSIRFQHTPVTALMVAIFAAIACFIIEGSMGFSLADEGFLWYGAQRTILGEVPIRDFTSYEPGRYYWLALWGRILNDTGVGTMRLSVYAFWSIGVMSVLLIIDAREWKSQWSRGLVWLSSILTFFLWAHPRHKLFDISISMCLTAILTWLLLKPAPKRFFIMGFCLGLTAFFGRNHALYGAVGLLLALLISRKSLQTPPARKTCFALTTGGFLGASPLLFLSIFVPGFFHAYLESILAVLRLGQTNLPLPIPWPWLLKSIDIFSFNSLRQISTSALFIAILIIPLLKLLHLIISRNKIAHTDAPMIAATSLAIPYAHFAFSRADLSHLAQAIHPTLVLSLLIAINYPRLKTFILCTIMSVSLVICLRAHPYFQCIPHSLCSTITVSNQILSVRKETAITISTLNDIYSKYGDDSRTFLVAPLWPGAYALFEKKAPVLWTYPLFAQTNEAQQAEISRIQHANPSFALIVDHALNGIEQLRFRHTNPLIVAYLDDNYTRLKLPENPAFSLYIPKQLPPDES